MNRLEMLQNMLSESPKDAFLLFAMAKEYEKTANSEKALEYYQSLRTINPDYVGGYYHYGQLLSQNQRYDEAVEVLDAGIAVATKIGDRHALSELMALRMEYDD